MSFKQGFAALCFAVFMAAAPFFVFSPPQTDAALTYSGVLNLWQIDGFEGGKGSRAEFLKKRAIEFEGKNKGVFVSVQTYTYEQAEQKLAAGDGFDLISFTAGIGALVLNKVQRYEGTVFARDDLLCGGMIDNAVYALPWAFGGYALSVYQNVLNKNESDISLDIGFAQFNDPFRAMLKNKDKITKNYIWGEKNLTSYQAYEVFLKKKDGALLATQRDVARFDLKQSQGKPEDVRTLYFGDFTDLVQYIAFCDNGSGRANAAQAFMQYLTCDEAQKKLVSIGMFSPSLDLYSSGVYFDMQKALSSPLAVTNVFTPPQELFKMRQEDARALFGGQNAVV